MSSAVRTYRGRSAAERRSERRTRLLAACLDVVGTSGLLGVTVEAVCARAGLTKRYFYEAFADRDALLCAVADDMFGHLHGVIVEALGAQSVDARRRASATVDALVTTLDDDARLARFYVESPGHPLLLARRDARVDAFAELLLDHVLLLPPDAPGRPSVRASAVLVVAGTTHLITRWLDGAVELSRPELVEEITRTGMAALGG